MVDLIVGIIFVLMWAAVALVPAVIAYSSKRRFLYWWLYGFFLFPVALIHALVVRVAAILRGLQKISADHHEGQPNLPNSDAGANGSIEQDTFEQNIAAGPFRTWLGWAFWRFLARNYLTVWGLIFATTMAPTLVVWGVMVGVAILIDVGRKMWSPELNHGPEEMYAHMARPRPSTKWYHIFSIRHHPLVVLFCATLLYYPLVIFLDHYLGSSEMRGYYDFFSPFYGFMESLSAEQRLGAPFIAETGYAELAAIYTHLNAVLSALVYILGVSSVCWGLYPKGALRIREKDKSFHLSHGVIVLAKPQNNAGKRELIVRRKVRRMQIFSMFILPAFLVIPMMGLENVEPGFFFKDGRLFYPDPQKGIYHFYFIIFAHYFMKLTVIVGIYFTTLMIFMDYYFKYLEYFKKPPFATNKIEKYSTPIIASAQNQD